MIDRWAPSNRNVSTGRVVGDSGVAFSHGLQVLLCVDVGSSGVLQEVVSVQLLYGVQREFFTVLGRHERICDLIEVNVMRTFKGLSKPGSQCGELCGLASLSFESDVQIGSGAGRLKVSLVKEGWNERVVVSFFTEAEIRGSLCEGDGRCPLTSISVGSIEACTNEAAFDHFLRCCCVSSAARCPKFAPPGPVECSVMMMRGEDLPGGGVEPCSVVMISLPY